MFISDEMKKGLIHWNVKMTFNVKFKGLFLILLNNKNKQSILI